jgi:sugar/nucleoside kinase (ribokinase family)
MASKSPDFDVVAVGEIVWEHRVSGGGFPALSGKGAYRRSELRAAGVAALCLALAERGRKVAVATVLGEDERDENLIRQFQSAGINVSALLRKRGYEPAERWVFEDGETGTCTTLTEEDDGYPAEALKAEWVASGRELWVDDDHSPATRRAIALAEKAGVPVQTLEQAQPCRPNARTPERGFAPKKAARASARRSRQR